jgi:hypothetical protein
MTTKIASSMPVRTAVACLALLGAGQSMAQTLTGNVTNREGNGGWIADITFATGSSSVYGATGVIACIEPGADFPALPSTHTYDVVGAAGVINASATYANKADALMNWVVDHYYTQTLAWNIDGQDFNQVLWEITQDFTGTASSMAFNAGAVQSTRADYRTMLSELKNAYSTISDTYRSSTFQVHYLVDRDTRYQNMILVTAVPEPSSYLMMFAGVGALLVWRRRSGAR